MLLHCKKYILLTVIQGFVFTFSFAQQKQEKISFQFHSINQAGLLNGQHGSALQLQTINGFQRGSWFGGIGVGLDYYRFRGVPLFVDIRKEFGRTKNKLFVYGDGGIHFSWVTDKEKNSYAAKDHFSNGLYTDVGIGYKVNINRKNALLLSAGYSHKTVKETVSSYITDLMIPNPYPNSYGVDKYNYQLNCLSIKVGWEF